MGPRAVLDVVVKRNSQPPPGIEPWNLDLLARSPALYRLSWRRKIPLLSYPVHGESEGSHEFPHYPGFEVGTSGIQV
jgi:hypothetical protein